jgi:16S rRNA (guanine(966)-N(2))-methyltransferase RsmD
VRVVAGALRGRRLEAPKGDAVRPTADRVREAAFSILGDVSGARVLDLYCGTGAMGIEAVSRGAASAELVDTEPAPAQSNVSALGIEDRCTVVRADALDYLRLADTRYDLVFCDPPYRLADRLAPQLEEAIPPRLAEEGRVIVESAARSPIALDLPLLKERRYGATLIRIHTGPAR